MQQRHRLQLLGLRLPRGQRLLLFFFGLDGVADGLHEGSQLRDLVGLALSGLVGEALVQIDGLAQDHHDAAHLILQVLVNVLQLSELEGYGVVADDLVEAAACLRGGLLEFALVLLKGRDALAHVDLAAERKQLAVGLLEEAGLVLVLSEVSHGLLQLQFVHLEILSHLDLEFFDDVLLRLAAHDLVVVHEHLETLLQLGVQTLHLLLQGVHGLRQLQLLGLELGDGGEVFEVALELVELPGVQLEGHGRAQLVQVVGLLVDELPVFVADILHPAHLLVEGVDAFVDCAVLEQALAQGVLVKLLEFGLQLHKPLVNPGLVPQQVCRNLLDALLQHVLRQRRLEGDQLGVHGRDFILGVVHALDNLVGLELQAFGGQREGLLDVAQNHHVALKGLYLGLCLCVLLIKGVAPQLQLNHFGLQPVNLPGQVKQHILLLPSVLRFNVLLHGFLDQVIHFRFQIRKLHLILESRVQLLFTNTVNCFHRSYLLGAWLRARRFYLPPICLGFEQIPLRV